MMWTVVGVLSLSCLSLSVVGMDSLLIRVDITMPVREGRRQCHDVQYIENTFSQLAEIGFDVIFLKKGLGNKNILLVVEVHNMSCWSSLSSSLSKQGYLLSVTLLQTCEEYADELGIKVEYHPENVQKHDMIYELELVYYDKGVQIDDYTTTLTNHFKRDATVLEQKGVDIACYRSYGALPVKLMYLVQIFNSTVLSEAAKIERTSGKASMDINQFQSFQSYTQVFRKLIFAIAMCRGRTLAFSINAIH